MNNKLKPAITFCFLIGSFSAYALGPRIPNPIKPVITQGDITIGLTAVANGLGSPVTATYAPTDKDHLYVAEQDGKIWAITIKEGLTSTNTKRLFADISAKGLNLGCFDINYDERGLLGLAFHPDYLNNGLVYTYQSEPHAGSPKLKANLCNSTFPDHDNVVTEWKVTNPDSENASIDPASSREVLRIAHPQFNHNGGELRFSPSGMLYISVGDGGNADDQGDGHTLIGGNAQDLSTLNGKILRINPVTGSVLPGYKIPTQNPFVNVDGARGEIWALGFRNPFKMSFDRGSGKLIVADVGQNDIEEIDIVKKGNNYGWPIKEGTFAFNQNGADAGYVTGDQVTGAYVDPIAEYDHCRIYSAIEQKCMRNEGVAIVGGFVYHGNQVNDLYGRYVFGDYSTDFFKSDGRLFYLNKHKEVKELRIAGRTKLNLGVLGIGQDASGELYVLGKSGASASTGNTGITDPNNKTGVVLKLIPVSSAE